MTLRFRHASVALAAMLAMTGAAHAATTASASLTNLSITLIDTDLSDGIEASITFNDPYGHGYGTYVASSASVYVNGLSESDSDYDYGTFQNTFLSSNSASAAVTHASSQVATTESSVVMSASADLVGDNLSVYGYEYASANSSAYPFVYWYGGTFTLSANTLLVVRGNYSLAVNVDGVVDAPTSYYDQASASFSFSGSLSETNATSQSFTASRSLNASNYTGYGWPASDSASGTLYGALYNGSATSLNGNLYMSASVSAYDHSVTPVPEAQTTALALGGLGVFGLLAARRRKA